MNGRIKMQKKFEKKFKNDDEKREYYRNKAQEYRRNVLDRDIENNYFSYRKDTQGPVNTDDTPFIPPMPDKKSQDAYFRKLVNIDRNRHLKEPGWSYEETVTHDLSDEYGWDWTPGHAGYRTDVFAAKKKNKNCVFDLGKFCGVNKKPEELEVNECTMPFQSGKFSGVSICRDKNGYFVTTHRSRSKSYKSIDKIPISVIKKVEKTGNLKKEVIMEWEILKEASKIRYELERMLTADRKRWKQKQDKQYERSINIGEEEKIFLTLDTKLAKRLGNYLEDYLQLMERQRGLDKLKKDMKKRLEKILHDLDIPIPEAEKLELEDYLRLLEEGGGKVGSLEPTIITSVENIKAVLRISKRVRASVNAGKLLQKIPEIIGKIREIVEDDELFAKIEAVIEELYDLIGITEAVYKEVRGMTDKILDRIQNRAETGETEEDIGKGVMRISSYEKRAFLNKVWDKIKLWFKKIKDAITEWVSSFAAAQDDLEETNDLLEELRENFEVVEQAIEE